MSFNGRDGTSLNFPINEGTNASLYWVGNKGGYPTSLTDQSLNFIGSYSSTGPFQDIGLHKEAMYTKQPTVQLKLQKWNPNTTPITDPLPHHEAVGFRPLVSKAIEAFNQGTDITEIKVGEQVSSSWGSLWIKATVTVPSRIYTTGGAFPWKGPMQLDDNDKPIYRNRQNEIQLHYDFGGEAVVHVAEKAINIREEWTKYQHLGPESIQDTIIAKYYTQSRMKSVDDGTFVVAQGFAAVAGGDRRTQYPLYYYMADNWDITKPDELPQNLIFTLYFQNHYNSLFGNADNGDNIAPPAPIRHFIFKQFDIMHWYARYNELFYDFGIAADIASIYHDHVFGKEANRLCQFVANTLLSSKTRQHFKSNISMYDFFQRYVCDGDVIDINNSEAIVDVYNSFYDELYSQCLGLLSQFFDGTNKDQIKFFNKLLTQPKSTLPSSIVPSNTTVALGHAHIDTCWLWSYAHTRSKVVASWSNQLSIGHSAAFHSFCFSSGVQMKWLKEDHPQLFAILQQRVANSDDASMSNPKSPKKLGSGLKQGGFYPLGGTYLENDTNIPNLEHLIRQFVIGQRYFQRYWKRHSTIFHLPDCFGFSAAMPQICRNSGIPNFITQKLSWNNINKPAHNTIYWQGLDGASLLTHFPPSNTYNWECQISNVLEHINNNKDAALTPASLALFGFGDGGGGPIRRMTEDLITRISAIGSQMSNVKQQIDRQKQLPALKFGPRRQPKAVECTPNLQSTSSSSSATGTAPPTTTTTTTVTAPPSYLQSGNDPITASQPTISPLPTMVFTSPEHLFEMFEGTKDNFNTIVGELYLEFHRGTFTSQRMIKTGNDITQTLLYQAEMYLCFLYLRTMGIFYNWNKQQDVYHAMVYLHLKETDPNLFQNKTKNDINSIVYDKMITHLQDLTDFMVFSQLQIRKAWEIIMLNAFHDAIPGSSINIANQDITQLYAQSVGIATWVIRESLTRLNDTNGIKGVKGANVAIPVTNNNSTTTQHSIDESHFQHDIALKSIQHGVIYPSACDNVFNNERGRGNSVESSTSDGFTLVSVGSHEASTDENQPQPKQDNVDICTTLINTNPSTQPSITPSAPISLFYLYNPLPIERTEWILVPQLELFDEKTTTDSPKTAVGPKTTSSLTSGLADNNYITFQPTHTWIPQSSRDQWFYSHYRGIQPWTNNGNNLTNNKIPDQWKDKSVASVLYSMIYNHYYPQHTYTSSLDLNVDYYSFHMQTDEMLASQLDYYLSFDHNDYTLKDKHPLLSNYDKLHRGIVSKHYIKSNPDHNLTNIGLEYTCGDDVQRVESQWFATSYTNPFNNYIDARPTAIKNGSLVQADNSNSSTIINWNNMTQYSNSHALINTSANTHPGELHYNNKLKDEVNLSQVPIFSFSQNGHYAINSLVYRLTTEMALEDHQIDNSQKTTNGTKYTLKKVVFPPTSQVRISVEQNSASSNVPTIPATADTSTATYVPAFCTNIPDDKVYIKLETVLVLPKSTATGTTVTNTLTNTTLNDDEMDDAKSIAQLGMFSTHKSIESTNNTNLITFNTVTKTVKSQLTSTEPLQLDILVLENSQVRYEILPNGRFLRAFDKRTIIPPSSSTRQHQQQDQKQSEPLLSSPTLSPILPDANHNIQLHRPYIDTSSSYNFQKQENFCGPNDDTEDSVQDFFVNGARSIYQQPHPSIYANYLSLHSDNSTKAKTINTHPVYIKDDLWGELNQFAKAKADLKTAASPTQQQPLRFSYSKSVSVDAAGANRLAVTQEMGTYYDAWDVELHASQNVYSLIGHYIESSSISEGPAAGDLYNCAVIKIYYHLYNEPLLNKKTAQSSTKNSPSTTPQTTITINPLNSFKFTETSTSQCSFYHHIVQTISLYPDTNLIKFDLLLDNISSNHKIIRTSFPAYMGSQSHALYEVQGGYLERPNTNTNNSFNIAQFEVVAQKWCAVQEGNATILGSPQSNQLTVAIETVAAHGFSASHNTITLSLVRSPKRPDNYCDNHIHSIFYQVGSYLPLLQQTTTTKATQPPLPTSVFSQIIHDALILQTPIITMPLLSQSKYVTPLQSYCTTTTPNVLITAIKMAENSIISSRSRKFMNSNPYKLFDQYVHSVSTTTTSDNNTRNNNNNLWNYIKSTTPTATSLTNVDSPNKLNPLFQTLSQLSLLDFTSTIVLRVDETCGIASNGFITLSSDLFDLTTTLVYQSNLLEYSTPDQLQNPVQVELDEAKKVWKIPYTLGGFKFQTFVLHFNTK